MDALTCPSCGAVSLPSTDRDANAGIAKRLSQALGQRYRIERELGRGGTAVVFLAHDQRHDRRVAIKVLLPEVSQFLGAERFLREIHIAAQLNHPHILPLHDSGEADGLLFYVMPYIESDSLRRRLSREGPLPVAEAIRIAVEVTDGLEYAHRRGVVHRDIKPENILLTERHAVIADFGIARPAVKGGATITTVGVSLGTPDYMSPEQIAADPALDHRTDVYSLGCTLYEMLTGKSPFAGPTPQVQARHHFTHPVPSARSLRRAVPAVLDAVVQRAMAKAPADRFATAGQFGAALAGLPIAIGDGAPPARPMVVRYWGVLAAGLVVVAGAGALLLGRGHRSTEVALASPLRVVVSPFTDRTGVLGTMTDQLTESLTSLLQPVRPSLEVTAYPLVAALKNPSLDTLRARFSPDRFVIGRVEAGAGDSLRVTVQVVDPAGGSAVPEMAVVVGRTAVVSTSLLEPLGDFVLHVLSQDLQNRARRAMVRNDSAWNLIQQAEHRMDDAEQAILVHLDGQGFRSLELADSLLGDARRLDSESDLIPLDIARLTHSRAFYVEYLRQQLAVPPSQLPDPAAERARALAGLDTLIRRRGGPAEAYELRGTVKEGLYRSLGSDSLLKGALADYQKATDLDRSRASAWLALSNAFSLNGQYPDALLALRQAMDQDMFHLLRRTLLRNQFDTELLASRNDSAAAVCHKGAAWGAGDVQFRDCLIELWSRAATVDRQQAAVARAKADSLDPLDEGTLPRAHRELWIAEILAKAGRGASADTVARRAMANVPVAWLPVLLSEAAYLRMLRGDRDSALALVKKVVEQDRTWRPHFRSAPWFLPLRADPRFIALVGEGAAPR